MRHILEHVPALVKTYGKWPSLLVVLLRLRGAAALALVIMLHHLLR